MTTPVGNAEFRNAKKYWFDVAEINYFALKNNEEIRFASKYAIILCIEGSIQIGKYILNTMNIPHPEKNADVFLVLSQHHILHNDLAHRLGRLARFRNDLVHDYDGVDVGKLQKVLSEDFPDIEEFQEIALKWERRHSGRSVISQMFDRAGVKTVLRSILRI
ncbi:type VII toxin-antitoxin system HepT family RNase toxin [Methanospirillum lacunae]|uniref:DUF86 domain-containing protein n=1 Tax=Methanospirillum lacunae TaxID=668570 RepID=A0A2V2N851_9EURY|nr:HepT-like ribonuclease domain-containing protein [Methanospirillum lacunae]PWR73876.1 hypothetical protein DK846_01550 [Methanospirillum lacunae]